MGIACAIVGLPNVGKSTLFNALTKAGIEASNYPFCTIEPNVGLVPVPDPRLDALARIVKPKKIIPTVVEFFDIAGLVAGAHAGEGLGNQFLAHIRNTDAIAHIVRCFDDENITHVAGNCDPLRDIETINTELLLADLDTIDKRLTKLGKKVKGHDKAACQEHDVLSGIRAHLDQGKFARTWPDSAQLAQFDSIRQLITSKPVMFIANVSEGGLTDNPYLAQLEAYAKTQGSQVLAICARLEAEIADCDEQEKAEYLAELNLQETGLARVIHAAYELLALQTFFTAGPKEVRAWTVKVGAGAAQAAGVIHSDFEKGFIRAEVIAFDDFIACQGENGAKEAGKWRLEGRAYPMHDGDVVHFRFNV